MNTIQMFEEVSEYLPHFVPEDNEVAVESKCEKCGNNMSYRGFKKEGSYRAFAICKECDIVDEF